MPNVSRSLPPDIEIARRADPADRGHRRAARHRGRRPGALRQVQGQGLLGPLSPAARPTDRQTGPGDRHHAHARRRRQDDHQHRPVRRAEPHRQAGQRLSPRAVAGAVLRHEGRGCRRRQRPGHPHGGHQPPFHGRFPRHRTGPQSPGRDVGQPCPPRQRPGNRPAADRLEAGRRHERPGLAEHHRRPGRGEQFDAPRRRIRHHRRLRGHGLLLPLRVAQPNCASGWGGSSSPTTGTASRSPRPI